MTEQTQLVLADTATTNPIIPVQAALRLVRSSPAWVEDDDDEARRCLAPNIVAALPAAIAEAEMYLVPTSRELMVKGLTSALTLVAGVGMGEGERKTWLAAAAVTLRELPEDLFRRGIDAARRSCDHPAKVVPAVLAEVRVELDRRKRALGRARYLLDLKNRPRRPWEPDDGPEEVCTPAQAAFIKAEIAVELAAKRNHQEIDQNAR